jgi:hypothetical protein
VILEKDLAAELQRLLAVGLAELVDEGAGQRFDIVI